MQDVSTRRSGCTQLTKTFGSKRPAFNGFIIISCVLLKNLVSLNVTLLVGDDTCPRAQVKGLTHT